MRLRRSGRSVLNGRAVSNGSRMQGLQRFQRAFHVYYRSLPRAEDLSFYARFAAYNPGFSSFRASGFSTRHGRMTAYW